MKEKLLKIQNEFKSSKNLVNDFGKFKYRNLECMLTDLKPILYKYNCIITFNDEIVNVGQFNYIKSTVTLSSTDTTDSISTTAFAREDENKSGMSSGQMTGCSSSYSRKYALCGLFAVNEEKDLDEFDNTSNNKKVEDKPNNDVLLKQLTDFCAIKKGVIDNKQLMKFFDYWKNQIESNKYKNPHFKGDFHFNNFISKQN